MAPTKVHNSEGRMVARLDCRLVLQKVALMVAQMAACLDKQTVPCLEFRRAAKMATLQVGDLDKPKAAKMGENWVHESVVSMAAKTDLDLVA
jgi:hypothetical protein